MVALTSYPSVPYVPSPDVVVKRMLELAKVGPEDVVYDLGAGDGRIIITAVADFKAKKAVGIEMSDDRIKEAMKNIELKGLQEKVLVKKANFFEADLSEASVVTMFLLSNVNDALRPKLEKELKPGTRVVSHEFEMRGWKPKEVAKVEEGSMSHTVYLYIIGETGQ